MNQEQSEPAAGTAPPSPEALESLSGAIERGRHLALIAAEGAGLAPLYAAAAVRDLAAGEAGGRAFVLTATVDRARRCAAGMHAAARAAGHEVVITPGAAAGAIGRAPILVGPPAVLLEGVRRGDIPAGALCTLVLDDVRALEPARAAVEAVVQASGDGARRIATTHARDAGFDELIERWLPRARRWPNELFAEPRAGEPEAGRGAGTPIAVASQATREGRLTRLTELLHDLTRAGAAAAASVETAPAAVADVSAALSLAGLRVAGSEAAGTAETDDGETETGGGAGETDGDAAETDGGDEVRVGAWGEVDPAAHAVAFELPPTPEPLARAAADAERCYAIVDSLHERQLELTALRAGLRVAPLAESADPALLDDVAAFRARVSSALEQQDLAAGALLLAPLMQEHGAARVAAALAGLLRAADRPAAGTREAAPGDAPPGDTAAARPDTSARRATRPTWTKVFVGVGRRDGAGPGDLVGAITGETSVAGGQIGRIDIRQNFTLVDIDSLVADAVVRGLDGSRIKGRQVVARLDRGAR
ncbi:DbpA RNA binding domain-containing protein [Candidatus Palauibacter soopunensis]|uniref:DbpA RNA binding domain-containing protein n=1 Tax=Candidatus Palauibacter soopunensis TaxID=3056739 RepID=UPI0023964A9C|nr:DbpA RNA binding domain-containing protein [Candidatus Palauibacter soopunensis]MDE2879129.1 DbpA RNA binding domain-containing protein [Candidatus Palauibacter soopunensis]